MEGSLVVARVPRQVSCPLREEAAVLNMNTGRYYGLNAVGARIWSLLERPVTLREVADTILAEYDVSPATCEQDLVRLVAELSDAGLVEIQREPLEPMAAPPAR